MRWVNRTGNQSRVVLPHRLPPRLRVQRHHHQPLQDRTLPPSLVAQCAEFLPLR
ncbi:hypothetical protein L210DRAFT_3565882, partial [Boletus edulis BED1]